MILLCGQVRSSEVIKCETPTKKRAMIIMHPLFKFVKFRIRFQEYCTSGFHKNLFYNRGRSCMKTPPGHIIHQRTCPLEGIAEMKYLSLIHI